jgi:Alternative oxidase
LRIIFLETVAGVPGMVGGMIRHLRSLRKMEKEGRWIETLLEEAENERMHLMTFMAIKKPGPFMRLMIVGAQGVFCNAFFFSYLLYLHIKLFLADDSSPRTCHRFVGYLEEEAVITYTRCLADLKAGLLPAWSSPEFKVPEIAKDYWHLPENCTMEDLLLAIRADEAGHRHVNHTLASLEARDKNPFTPEEMARHGRKQSDARGLGWDRDELKL